MSEDDAVLIETERRVGRIRLNSSKTLNALTLESITRISEALSIFRDDPAISVVVIDHVGERGFCAGGDAIGLAKSARDDGAWARAYFTQQYAMDALIATFPKPIVTVADGATIGGGLGLLLGAAYRVVTERSMIAFLETSIGMAPDVGVSWALPRLPHGRGMWMALTGAKQVGIAGVEQGLANVLISSNEVATRMEALCVDTSQIDTLFAPTQHEPPAMDAKVREHFNHDTLEKILNSLKGDGSEWAAKQLAAIRRASPMATAATFRLLQAGKGAIDIGAALDNELSTNMALLKSHDFKSFARANLLERDRPVSWNPDNIEALLQENIVPSE